MEGNDMADRGNTKNDMIVRKKEFSDMLAKNCGMSKLHAFWVVNVFWDTLLEFLADGYAVSFCGIGRFEVKKTKGMWTSNLKADNLKPGEKYYVPERRKVKFRPSDALQRKIEEL